MTNEWTGTMIIDEIDRLTVAYEKAKEYLTKITTGIDQQINIWQYRQQILREQLSQTTSSSSYDFLLPKTQRINELTLEAVQSLCRTDLLVEQILRIDLKSRLTPSVIKSSVSNEKIYAQPTLPIPVLRPQPSDRLSTITTPEKSTVKNSIPPLMESFSRTSSSIHEGYSLTRSVPLDHSLPNGHQLPNYQTKQPRIIKEKIPLQRIPAGTKWKQARIDIIDSLSGFYVGNLDQRTQEEFLQMQDELDDYYTDLEKSHQLIPLDNLAIGDFGVAKFSEDGRWYRARLIMCEGQNQIKIVFVDFGNIEIKSVKEFFPLEKSFTDLPAQAIACSLSQAYPQSQNDNETIWSNETIEIFRELVMNKTVEVQFERQDDGSIKWPLHFVRVLVDNQSVTNLPTLQKRIDPRPNSFIAEQMTPSLTEQEYILFNVPINSED